MNSLKTYSLNKVLSFAGVFLCIWLTYLTFGNSVEQWQAILLAIIIFGYSHFILGFYYQLRSFFRQPNPWQQLITFGFLTVASVLFAGLLLKYFGFTAALFTGFMYFLLHGLLNEQTLIKRQTGQLVPLAFLSALAVYVMSLLAYSVPDETFFFDKYLQFYDFGPLYSIEFIFEYYYMSLAHFTQLFWIGFSISIVILLFAWLRYGFGKLTILLGAMIGGSTMLVVAFGPPAYIYMYLLVVGYHFMTWLLFYIVEMKKRGPAQFRTFMLQNIVIMVPFLVGAYLFYQPNTPAFVYTMFDYHLFVIVTYIHISTSFMNDEWLKRIQAKVFARG